MKFLKSQIDQKLKELCQRKVAPPLRRKVLDPRKTGRTVFDIQPGVSYQEVVKILVEEKRIKEISLCDFTPSNNDIHPSGSNNL
jgi:hypothetical protein